MKNAFKISIFVLLLFLSQSVYSQKIFQVDAEYKADVKVFIVDSKLEADLLVYKAISKLSIEGNAGVWYFAKKAYMADKKVYFVSSEYQADLTIYYVKHKYQAGWRNEEKEYLLEKNQ